MRGYETDISASHKITRYLLITKLGIQPSEIDKLGMTDINELIVIHAEAIKIEQENTRRQKNG